MQMRPYAIKTPGDEIMQNQTRLLHRQPAKSYKTAVGCDGVYLIDNDGNRYLDACGGAAVSCLGHGHPKIIAAIKEQLDNLAFAHTGFFSNEPAEALAEFLIKRSPWTSGRAVFVSGGSEAIEAALKITRQIHLERGDPKRYRYIARHLSYHGTTLGALAIGGHTARRAPYLPLIEGGIAGQAVSHIEPCYAYRHQRDGETGEAYGRRAAHALEAEILRVGPENVAAFVAETVVGATAGVVSAAPGYFKEIRRICDQYGVFLILDEVMSGMGRTGTLFACEQEGIEPDMIAIAKGLAAGYQPIGAVLIREDLARAVIEGSGALAHGHTYMAHATACAAAMAVQNVIEDENLLDNVVTQGDRLAGQLRARFGNNPHVGDIRQRGLFIGLELVEDRTSKTPFPAQAGLAERIKSAAMAEGLICYPASGAHDGEKGDHILLAPPYLIEPHHLDIIVDRLESSLDAALKDIKDLHYGPPA